MLRDCVETGDATELIVVRRGRLARVARAERSRFTQALLTLWPLGVDAESAALDEILDDRGAKEVIAALGVGIQFDGESSGTFRLDRLRYGKIVLAMDDGPRGRLASERFLAFVARCMRPILTAGHVYASSTPLRAGMTETEFVSAVLDPGARNLTRVGPERSSAP